MPRASKDAIPNYPACVSTTDLVLVTFGLESRGEGCLTSKGLPQRFNLRPSQGVYVYSVVIAIVMIVN